VTAGIDSQKNHSLGIFRGTNDTFPFRNTHKYDLQEAYVSFLLPLGDGLIVKGGKFVTLLGYEVIESPNNLNFSRGYLFALAIPLTHTGGLLSYTFGEQFSVTAGWCWAGTTAATTTTRCPTPASSRSRPSRT
jgi:hypothetical protein